MSLHAFLWGMLTFGCLVCSAFFLRFQRVSKDRFFGFLAGAFFVFAVNWLSLALGDHNEESNHYYYVMRLIGFVLIIVGIIDKNRR